MGFGEGVLVALFVMALVFVLLGVIYVLVKMVSAIIQRYFGKTA
jgi:Na+-transporting methylmalonyl-CoA/oxaloacetate decarboxylase gamma subunit